MKTRRSDIKSVTSGTNVAAENMDCRISVRHNSLAELILFRVLAILLFNFMKQASCLRGSFYLYK